MNYTDNKITWQAHAVMEVNLEILSTKRFPNGSQLTTESRKIIQQEVDNCRELLKEYGCQIPDSRELQLEFKF